MPHSLYTEDGVEQEKCGLIRSFCSALNGLVKDFVWRSASKSGSGRAFLQVRCCISHLGPEGDRNVCMIIGPALIFSVWIILSVTPFMF